MEAKIAFSGKITALFPDRLPFSGADGLLNTDYQDSFAYLPK